MLKALLRKQWQQSLNFFWIDKRNGKRRSTIQIVLYAFLFIYLFAVLAGGAYWLCLTLCPPLHAAGLDWLYFTLTSMAAIIAGIFCGLFSTFSGLYQAKDNDLLFALPIPPRLVLFSRMVNCYLIGLLPMLFILIPSIIAYAQYGLPNVSHWICSTLLIFVLGFFVLVCSCLVGWILALINRRVRHKNLVTILLSIAFMGIYFYGYNQAYQLLQTLIANISTLGANIKGRFYPFYLLGKAFEGNISSMLFVTILTTLLFGISYWILSHSFLKLSTTQGVNNKRKTFKEDLLRSSSLNHTLLRKEFKRLLSSPTYLLNAALCSIICSIGIIVILFKISDLQIILQQIDAPSFQKILPVILAGSLASLSSMNMISSSSISMEGKNLWILRTLPIPTWKILRTKWNFHVLITFIPIFLLYLISIIICHIHWVESLLILLFFTFFIGFSAALGLNTNLRKPNLLWTNETAAVKENLGSMLCLFGEWGILAIFAIAYILCNKQLAENEKMLPPIPVLAIATCCMALLFGISTYQMKHKGVKRFENL